MIGLIEQIEQLGWGTVIICFLLVICVVVTAISGYKKILSTLGLRSTHSLKEEQVDRELARMQSQIDGLKEKMKQSKSELFEKQEEYHQQSIEIRDGLNSHQKELKEDIKTLTVLLQQFIGEQNLNTVAILRSSLWRLHKDFVSQGYVTPDGLKTFMEMGKRYEKAGGNDIYHEKLLPEVEALPIHYPDGSIYNPRA